MSDKSQIEAAARNLMRRFGDDALRQADIRIAELEQHGEAEGLKFWCSVRDLVRESSQGRGSTKH
ncbi:MAG: hypothetical protein QF521_23545 [Alphaproteobacteria bacterium]|jgi:hypothetical protein|nr:hypothetical protein [Alphaproteobacteria bacterium]